MKHLTLGRRALAIATVLLLAGAGMALGQAQSGNLYGKVIDNDGSPLPGVTVTVSGVGAAQIQITDAGGNFRFLGLSPAIYQLTAELEGFSTVEYPNVTINVGRNTTLEIELSPALEETITVTSESPLLDERKISTGSTVSQTELEKIPTSRDPWAILQTVPGVQTDRINVGGNESGQQSQFIGPGSNRTDGVWAVDGVVITDMGAIGASPTYYNFDAFEEMQVSTGGSDATLTSGGVTLNMVTKRGTNEWRGSGRFIQAKDSWQSNLSFNVNELADGQDEFKQGNRIVSVDDYGLEAGGPLVQDKLWIWFNYGVQEVDLLTVDDVSDFTELESYGAKLNAQLTSSNSLVAFYNYGDKIKIGRNASPTRPQPTTWNQTGPTDLYKLEDTHIFNSSFFLTGLASYVGGGFQLTPQGGLNGVNSILDANFVWQNNFLHHETERPQEQIKLDGSYFFNTGNLNHELKFGVGQRGAELTSLSVWPGNALRLDYGLSFGYPFNRVQISRPRAESLETDYDSLYIQDTLTAGNLTANFGLRYDKQSGNLRAAQFPAVPGFESDAQGNPLLPAGTTRPGPQGFEWTDISPRVGVTYALGEERDTLLRASFSQFAEQLGQGFTTQLSTAQYSYNYYYYEDLDGNGIVSQNEIVNFEDGPLFSSRYDPLGQRVFNQVDPGFDASTTDELILGVEHAFLPELVVGVTATLRNISGISEQDRLVCDTPGTNLGSCDGFSVRPDQRSDYEVLYTRPVTRPDGSTFDVPVWGMREGVTDDGSFILRNGDREQDYLGFSLSVNKRLANRWMLRGNFTWSDFEWSVPAGAVAEPNIFLGGAQDDGGTVLQGSGTGSGSKGGVYISSRWSYSLTGMYQVAPDRNWGFNVAASVNGREGYAVPFYTREFGIFNDSSSVRLQATTDPDEFRLDDVQTIDLRVEKEFNVNDWSFTVGAEVFNLLNEATVLQREHRLRRANTDFVREILSPRVFRLALRLNFR